MLMMPPSAKYQEHVKSMLADLLVLNWGSCLFQRQFLVEFKLPFIKVKSSTSLKEFISEKEYNQWIKWYRSQSSESLSIKHYRDLDSCEKEEVAKFFSGTALRLIPAPSNTKFLRDPNIHNNNAASSSSNRMTAAEPGVSYERIATEATFLRATAEAEHQRVVANANYRMAMAQVEHRRVIKEAEARRAEVVGAVHRRMEMEEAAFRQKATAAEAARVMADRRVAWPLPAATWQQPTMHYAAFPQPQASYPYQRSIQFVQQVKSEMQQELTRVKQEPTQAKPTPPMTVIFQEPPESIKKEPGE